MSLLYNKLRQMTNGVTKRTARRSQEVDIRHLEQQLKCNVSPCKSFRRIAGLVDIYYQEYASGCENRDFGEGKVKIKSERLFVLGHIMS